MGADVQFSIEAIDKTTSVMRNISYAITGFNQGMQAMQQIARGVTNAIDQTVGAYVKYADQVRRISQITGQQAEEVSRLIQVSDDYKISTDTLTLAMRKMAAEGNALTIDSLGKMSDAYLKLAPGVERQTYLTQNFGRAGNDFAEIMLAGSNAIEAQSMAISANLILTEKAVKAAREYEKSMDTLKDTMDGVKIKAGMELTPTLNVLLTTTQESKAEWMKYVPVLNSVYAAYELIVLGSDKVKQAQEDADPDSATQSYTAWAKSIQAVAEAFDEAAENAQDFTAIAKGTNTSLADIAVSAYMTQLSLDGLFTYDDARKVLEYRLSIGDLTQAEFEAQMAALNLQNQLALFPDHVAVNVDVNYNYHGSAYTLDQAAGYGGTQEYARGGFVSNRYAITGDAPDGHRTGYEELVDFQSKRVYSAPQTRAMIPHLAGGSMPGIEGLGMINLSPQSIRDLADALSFKLQPYL